MMGEKMLKNLPSSSSIEKPSTRAEMMNISCLPEFVVKLNIEVSPSAVNIDAYILTKPTAQSRT
jgi:hypothetical protein